MKLPDDLIRHIMNVPPEYRPGTRAGPKNLLLSMVSS
jgi:hypothetical protein